MVNRVATPVEMIVGVYRLNSVIVVVNSAIRFVVGGSAMFLRLARSHHVAVSCRRGAFIVSESKISAPLLLKDNSNPPVLGAIRLGANRSKSHVTHPIP